MPLANQQQPEHFIFMDSLKSLDKDAPVGKKAGRKLSLLGKRWPKKIKGDIGARGTECPMRENPQELVGFK